MGSYTVEQFLELEGRVWNALAAGDAVADERLLADDFLGVYPGGFSDKAGHVGQLKAGPTVSSYELSEARIRVLAAETVLLSYRAQWARCAGGSPGGNETMHVTSIWQRRDGAWKNVFSQDTTFDSPGGAGIIMRE